MEFPKKTIYELREMLEPLADMPEFKHASTAIIKKIYAMHYEMGWKGWEIKNAFDFTNMTQAEAIEIVNFHEGKGGGKIF